MTREQLREFRSMRRELARMREEKRTCSSSAPARLRRLNRAIDSQEALIQELRARIESAIAVLPDLQQKILRERYIDGDTRATWLQAAKKLNYSASHIRHKHTEALRTLEGM